MYSCGLARSNLPELLKQALQDEVGHLADLAGVLRHRDEQVGTGQGAVRPAPTQQGFGPDAVATVEIENRLIQHLQLAAANGPRQFRIQRLALAHQQEHQEADKGSQHQTDR